MSKKYSYIRTITQLRELIDLLEQDLEQDRLDQDTLITLEQLNTLAMHFSTILKPQIMAYILED